MNLLFQALVIFAFVMPGVLFRSAYFQGDWNYPLGRLGPVSEQVPRALVVAAILNWFVYAAVTGLNAIGCPGVPPIDLDSVVSWLSNNFGDHQFKYERAVASLTRSPTRIFLYFTALYALAWGGGKCLHNGVRRWRLDREWRPLRFDNAWHYLLRGEILDFPDQAYNSRLAAKTESGAANRHEATVIAAVVDAREHSYLYLGTLVDFYFDANGELDRLLLEGVKRRTLDADELQKGAGGPSYNADRFYRVKGHYFVLRLAEVKTLNVDYLTTEDLERANAMQAEPDGSAITDGGSMNDAAAVEGPAAGD